MSKKLKVFINKLEQNFQKKHFLMMTLVVFLVVVSISIPVHQVHAGWPSGGSLLVSAMGYLVDAAQEVFGSLLKIIYLILIVVGDLLLNLSTLAVNVGAWFIDAALDPRLYKRVLESTTINIGWTTVRDMSNIFYVFFLLLIAFGTILRSSTYNAKNLLPKLVISLFLINFSAVIAKMVIDFGQIFMYGIMNWMGNFQDGANSLSSIVDRFNTLININSDISIDKVVLIFSALTYSLILAVIYVMLALFLMVRLVAFVFLIILSPFAFLSIAMPSLGKYTSEWWGELIKYSLFGPIFMFFIYLSATMANEMIGSFTPAVDTGWGFNSIKDVLVTIFPTIIPILMLLAIIPVTQKLGVAGAGKIIGGRAGLGNIVMGGYAGLKKAKNMGGKGVDVAASRSKWVAGNLNRIRDKKQRLLSKLGSTGRGMAIQNKVQDEKTKQTKIDNRKAKYGGEGNLENMDIDILLEGDDIDKSLALEVAAKRGTLPKILDENKDLFDIAKNHLSEDDIQKLADKDLRLTAETDDGQNRINALDNKGMDDKHKKEFKKATTDDEKKKLIKEQLMRERMGKIVQKGKAYEVQGLDDAMVSRIWDESQTSEQQKSSFNRMNEKDRKKLGKGYISNTKKVEEYTDEDERAKIEENNMKFSSNAVRLGQEINKSFKWAGDDIEEKIKEGFKDFNHKDVANLSSNDLKEYGHNATKEQIVGLNKAGSYKAVRIIGESMKKQKPKKYEKIFSNSITNPTKEEERKAEEKNSGSNNPMYQ